MTETERAFAKRETKGRVGGLLWLLMIFGVGTVFLVRQVGGWLFDAPGKLIGTAIGLGIVAVFAGSYWRGTTGKQRKAKADFSGSEVEEWAVETSRAVELSADHSSMDPAVLIEVGDGKSLLLCGQWLWNAETWGASAKPDEDDEPATFNRMLAPHGFPCARFTITRLPQSGEVISISVDGEYLAPTASEVPLTAASDPSASQLLDGGMDEVLAKLRAVATAD